MFEVAAGQKGYATHWPIQYQLLFSRRNVGRAGAGAIICLRVEDSPPSISCMCNGYLPNHATSLEAEGSLRIAIDCRPEPNLVIYPGKDQTQHDS